MPNPSSISDMPALTNNKVRKIYIKDGARKMSTDGGYMMMPQSLARRMFGKLRGGKYSKIQS